MRRAHLPVIACAIVASLAFGCRASIPPFAASLDFARHRADETFTAFAYRFYSVQRDPVFERARLQLGRYALTPSALMRDSSTWSLFLDHDSTRALFAHSGYADGHYRFVQGTSAPYPDSLGSQRHFMRLRWLGRGDYEWYTTVDHAVGHVKPAAAAAAIMATFTAAEGRPATLALADARATFPRSGAHLSRLFNLDSLGSTILGDGSTTMSLGLTVTSDRMRQVYPYFAAWLDKYLVPAIYHVRIADPKGATWLDVAGSEGRITIRLRSRGHRLVSLEGGAPMPDSLRMHVDGSLKWRMFRVGLRNMVGDLTTERGEHERAWMFRWTREPAWQFPLAIDKLIKVPLRRPFAGRGIEFRLGIRDDLGPQTMSVRYTRFEVSESAIMRWLGGLGATAFGDFTGRTELEENLFLYQLFAALREDISAIR